MAERASISLAQRLRGIAELFIYMLVEILDVDGLSASRALFVSSLLVAFINEMMDQIRDLHHLLATMAFNKHGTFLETVHV